MSRLFAIPPWPQVRRRLPYLIIGLVLCGIAFACIVQADLGLDPWDVLHQGISDRTGIPIGTVSVLVSFVVVLGWIPLRQRVGLGTVVNAVLIGTTMDVVLPHLPDPHSTAAQWALLVGGLLLVGPGIGMYIGARLGPGPRDGIMTGLAERGPSIRSVRTGIELVALACGFLLGGTIGIGTVLFALTVGPNAQFWLHRLDLGHPPGFEPVPRPSGHHEPDDPPPDIEPDFTTAGS
ncbi:YczE/YyaS/YitT family protein [Aquihabitans sp. McL0605]|uniref:membrane protein YczE n=1 Tax=Aquihabitans sp. McL0605 TaxID=3415671 RepID=UPI003CEF59F6